MSKKVLIFGSNGLVGSSVYEIFLNTGYKIFASTRKDTDLFVLDEVRALIDTFKPQVIINAAAKVGGILANNTERSEFLIQNLKINTNILEACIPFPDIKIIDFKQINYKLLFSLCIISLLLPLLWFFQNYIISGCLIWPIEITCFANNDLALNEYYLIESLILLIPLTYNRIS